VNVGIRQRGRPQAANVINCGYGSAEVEAGVRRSQSDPSFRAACAHAINPFGDGQSSQRIVSILRDVAIDMRLLDKKTTY
jgi:UDP-N-acetylglucosamine 2-epimerase